MAPPFLFPSNLQTKRNMGLFEKKSIPILCAKSSRAACQSVIGGHHSSDGQPFVEVLWMVVKVYFISDNPLGEFDNDNLSIVS